MPWRALGLIAWLGFVAWSFATWLFIDWPTLLLAGMCSALLFSRERGWRAALITVRDWFGLASFVLAYGLSRAAADTLGMPVQEQSMIDIDTWIGLGALPNHRLQAWIDWDGQPAWWEGIFPLTYVSHFIVTFSIMAVLYARNRPEWSRYMRRWVLLSGLGLVGYILMPTVPPWMSSELGTIATVNEGLPRGWEAVNIPVIEDLFSFGRDRANQIAAMPSLHAAYPMLLWLYFRSRGRATSWLLGSYVALMGFTIVITGQHWVIDVWAGWLVAWVAHRVIGWFEQRRRDTTDAPPLAVVGS